MTDLTSKEALDALVEKARQQKTSHEMTEEEDAGADYEDGWNLALEELVRPMADTIEALRRERDELEARLRAEIDRGDTLMLDAARTVTRGWLEEVSVKMALRRVDPQGMLNEFQREEYAERAAEPYFRLLRGALSDLGLTITDSEPGQKCDCPVDKYTGIPRCKYGHTKSIRAPEGRCTLTEGSET